jgi:CRISPR/Cas system CSM-associated protein Csm3 (group 7 of RAMP superfamily)
MTEVYLYRLKFNLPNGLRIGGVGDTTEPLRIGSEEYLIPSSTLKGMFRRATEVILGNPDHLKQHTQDNNVYSKYKALIEECEHNPKKCVDEVVRIAVAKGISDEKEFEKLYNQYNCPIERLYGGDYFAGSITISDVLIKTNIIERTHVAINRITKTNLENHLFTEEILDLRSIEVKVIVRGETNYMPWMRTLKFMRDVGTFIGNSKSRGIGFIQLDDKESRIAKVYSLLDKPIFKPLSDELK